MGFQVAGEAQDMLDGTIAFPLWKPLEARVELREMTIGDYDEVIALWRSCEGIGLSAADSRESIERYLARNPGMSFVAVEAGRMVGAVICGHDGRRGLLHHLAVAPSARRQGIGSRLVEGCLAGLKAAGIDKCHIFVYADNQAAIQFWERGGWFRRPELALLSYTVFS
jgi:putative acetyltransferase